MKKFIALFLLLAMNMMFVTPALADDVQEAQEQQTQNEEQTATPTLVSTVEDETVYLNPKSVYKLEFESDFDVNETKPDDEIYFRLVTPVNASNGMYLPEHTRFAGKFKKLSPSKPIFKRARAYIIIDKLMLPNEKCYTVRMEPKNGSDLKSSQLLNTIRAIPAGVGVLTFSALSVAVVAIESVTVVGLVVVPRTCKGFGLLISSSAKGLNYKAKAGKQILFKLDTPVYVTVSDLVK